MFTPQPPQCLDVNALPKADRAIIQSLGDIVPGPILTDFRTLLDYLAQEGMPITARSQLPNLKCLRDFNETLSRPTRMNLKRANQKHYVYAIALFWVARVMGFIQPHPSKKNYVTVVQDVVENWEALTPQEQYFSLLAGWLHYADPDMLGDRGLFPIHRCLELLGQLQNSGGRLQVRGCDPKEAHPSLHYHPGLQNLALLDGFGLIEVESVKPKAGKGWSMRSVAMTEMGRSLFTALSGMYPMDERFPVFGGRFSAEMPAGFAEAPLGLPETGIPLEQLGLGAAEKELMAFLQEVVKAHYDKRLAQHLEATGLDLEGRQPVMMLSMDEETIQNALVDYAETHPDAIDKFEALMEKADAEAEAAAEADESEECRERDDRTIRAVLATGEASGALGGFDLYYDSFREWVPGLSRSLTPSIPEFNENIFVFKVALGKVWRRLGVPGCWTLAQLAEVILDAFEFEDWAHLYAFRFMNTTGRMVEVDHEYAQFGIAKAYEVRVGDLPIAPGSHVDFNFDFGDDWHFDMALEAIAPIDDQRRETPNIELLGSKGKPPAQYPEEW